jgi:hypothetical protein
VAEVVGVFVGSGNEIGRRLGGLVVVAGVLLSSSWEKSGSSDRCNIRTNEVCLGGSAEQSENGPAQPALNGQEALQVDTLLDKCLAEGKERCGIVSTAETAGNKHGEIGAVGEKELHLEGQERHPVFD